MHWYLFRQALVGSWLLEFWYICLLTALILLTVLEENCGLLGGDKGILYII